MTGVIVNNSALHFDGAKFRRPEKINDSPLFVETDVGKEYAIDWDKTVFEKCNVSIKEVCLFVKKYCARRER